MFAQRIRRRRANSPRFLILQRFTQCCVHFRVVLQLSQRFGSISAIRVLARVLQLVQPFSFFFVELCGLQDVPARVKQHHHRRTVRRQRKRFFRFGNRNRIILRSPSRCDFNVRWNVEQSDSPFNLLCLLHLQCHLMFRGVIGVAQIKFRRSRSIDPLREKLIQVGMRFFFNRFRQVRGDHIFPAIHFQIMFQSAVKRIVAELVSQHVQHQPAFSVGISIKLARIIKVMPHNWLGPQIWLPEPLAHAGPTLIFRLVLRKIVLRPQSLHERRKAFVQPDISPVLASHQIAEPLVAKFM